MAIENRRGPSTEPWEPRSCLWQRRTIHPHSKQPVFGSKDKLWTNLIQCFGSHKIPAYGARSTQSKTLLRSIKVAQVKSLFSKASKMSWTIAPIASLVDCPFLKPNSCIEEWVRLKEIANLKVNYMFKYLGQYRYNTNWPLVGLCAGFIPLFKNRNDFGNY